MGELLKHEVIKDQVNEMYFKQYMSILTIAKHLGVGKQRVSMAIESIMDDRKLGIKLSSISFEITVEQVLKQNAFIEKHSLIRNRYAEPILLTNNHKVLTAYNKLINNNFKTVGNGTI